MSKSMRALRPLIVCASAAAAVACAAPSFGALTLTNNLPGYSLAVFASNFPTANNDVNGIGALQASVDPSGRVYVTDYSNGGMYVFPTRANGQNVANLAPTSQFIWGNQNANGTVQLDGHIYMTSSGASQFFDVDPTGFQNHSLWAGWSFPSGVVANPVTTGTFAVGVAQGVDQVHPGVFFSLGADANRTPAATGTIEFMDPTQAEIHDPAHPGTGIFITSGTPTAPDSMALSADGSVLVSVWNDGLIRAYSTSHIPTSFADTLWTMASTGGSVEMGTGNLAGDMFLSNAGELDVINVNTLSPNFGQKTVLATGGNYGGYLAADPVDGSLYVTESGTVYRLTAPTGGSFVSAPLALVGAVPEPASLALLGVGGLALLRRRKMAK